MTTRRILSIFLIVALCASLVLAMMPIGLAQSPPLLWYRTYGGTSDDEANGVIRTTDGGYAVAGWTTYSNGSIFGWLTKTDSVGNIQWEKKYGSPQSRFYAIVQTSDGGYALAGYTYSGAPSNAYAWLVRTDENGVQLWEQTYVSGYSGYTFWALCVAERTGGGFVLGGSCRYYTSGYPYYNELVIVTDSGGFLQNFYRGNWWVEREYTEIVSIVVAAGGGYFMSGTLAGHFALWKFDQSGNLIAGYPKRYGEGEAFGLAQGYAGRILLAGYRQEGYPWARVNYPYYISARARLLCCPHKFLAHDFISPLVPSPLGEGHSRASG